MRTPDWMALSGSQRRIEAEEKQSVPIIELLVAQRQQRGMPIDEQGLGPAVLVRQHHDDPQGWNAELAAADRPAL
jgi:hypothetical protein